MPAISPAGPKRMERQPTDRRWEVGRRGSDPREPEQRSTVVPGPRRRGDRGGPRPPLRRAEFHGAARIPRGPSSHSAGRGLTPRMRRGGGDCRDRLRVRQRRRHRPSRQGGHGADGVSGHRRRRRRRPGPPSSRARNLVPPALSSPCPTPVRWSAAARSSRLRASGERIPQPARPRRNFRGGTPCFRRNQAEKCGADENPSSLAICLAPRDDSSNAASACR